MISLDYPYNASKSALNLGLFVLFRPPIISPHSNCNKIADFYPLRITIRPKYTVSFGLFFSTATEREAHLAQF